MALTGPEALRALDDALRDVRREEDEVAKRAARHAEVLLKLRGQEAEAYRLLGANRLEPGLQAQQAGRLAQVGGIVEAAIARYDAAFADAEAGLQHIEAAIARASADRTSLQSEATRRDGELAALAAQARPTLGSNADYAGKLATARELSAVAEQAQLKAAQAEADREHNGRPFRDDELFMYLWTRGYATPSYRGKGLIASLDARIARFIGYEAARANFTALTEVPLQFRAHAARAQEAAQAAKAEIATFENVALDSAGGRAAREGLEAAIARLDALDRENVVLQDRRDEAIRTRSELAIGVDPDFAAALDELAEVLESDDLWDLVARARVNPVGNDTDVLQQLDDLRQRLKDESDETNDYRAQLNTLASRRRDLEDVQFELKARGYDNPHARFGNDDLVGELLNALLRGEMPATAYWDHWRRAQSWTEAGYGGPGGGWGRFSTPAAGGGLTRPRPAQAKTGMTSAA